MKHLYIAVIVSILSAPVLSYAQEQESTSLWDLITRKDHPEAVSASESESSLPAPSVPAPVLSAPLPPKKPDVPSTEMELDIEVSNRLSDTDARRYRKIFDIIRDGDITKARAEMKHVENGLLLGHAQARILLHPVHKARHQDLRAWLRQYNDHPQASRIYRLAQARVPRGLSVQAPDRPSGIFPRGILGSTKPGKEYAIKKKRTADQNAAVRRLKLDVRRLVTRTQPQNASDLLKESRASAHLDPKEYDDLRARIASAYFYAGYNDKAKAYAGAAFKRSGKKVPLSGWIYGLSQWRDDNYKEAVKGFERAASSAYASGWMVSAASYWAGRSHMRLSNHKKVSMWLERSAAFPRTFYGLVATRALGRDPVFDWTMPDYGSAAREYIAAQDHGIRAVALIKAGQIDLAEDEIRMLRPKDRAQERAVVAFANHYNLPSVSYRLGNALVSEQGRLYDGALYPMMPWIEQNAYKIDPALVHAYIRQESKFDSTVQSSSGATGLMQIMPATAKHLSGGRNFKAKADQLKLKDPSYNLKLGQKYLIELLDHPAVKGDLMSLAIAYNAGPGNLSRWKRERKRIDEPLLFIETIPFGETRAFVERVLANFWIYRVRMGKDTSTLEAVASGRWAKVAMDSNSETQHYAER